MSVIQFPTPGDDHHLSGQAVCPKCDHQWVAVAPVGVVNLECPSCHLIHGVFKAAVVPETAWKCNCGNQLFFLTPGGAMCRGCGLISSDWAN